MKRARDIGELSIDLITKSQRINGKIIGCGKLNISITSV